METNLDEMVQAYKAEVYQAVSLIDPTRLQQLAEEIIACQHRGGKILICGNGGSAATASHMVCDLKKNTGCFLRAFALNDNTPLMTAIANDDSYEYSFSYMLDALFEHEDILICISTSGMSPNVVYAAQYGELINAVVVGLMGNDRNSDLAKYCDYAFHVQSDNIGVVEDVHLIINHILTELIRELGNV